MENKFVGRVNFINMYEQAWKGSNLFGIFGMKTIGKSRTAREVIKRRMQLETMLRHIFIDMQGKGQFKMLLLQLLSNLDLHDHMTLQYGLEETMEHILVTIQQYAVNHNYILTFDNCETLIDRDEYSLIRFCTSLLTRTDNIRIVLTSSVSLPRESFPTLRVCFRELPPLTEEESYDLLKCIVPELDSKHGKLIADMCGGLPLVVLMVGAELSSQENVYTTEDMLVLLTQCRLQSISSEFYPASERVEIIFGKLVDQLSSLFQQRLASLHYIPVSFHRHQALDMIDSDEEDDNGTEGKTRTLLYFRTRHLLSADESTGRYNVHGILRECIEMFIGIKDIKKVRERFCKAFAVVFKDISSKLGTKQYAEALERLSHEFPNLQKLLSDVEYSTGDTYHVFVELVMTSSDLMHDYMGVESLKFYQKCLEITPNFGRRKDEAILKIGQGKCLMISKAQFKEAEKCYRDSIELIRDDPINAVHVSLYTALGRNLHQQSRRQESQRALNLALDIAGRLGMEDNDLMLGTLLALGSVHASAETYDQAEMYMQRALERSLKRFGTDQHLLVAECYNSLGHLHQIRQNYPVAFEFFKKSLVIRRNIKAAIRPLVLCINNVAMQYSVHGNNDQAVELLNEAKMLLDRSPSAQQYSYIATYESLARLHHRMKNLDIALLYFGEVLKIRNEETPGNTNVVEMLELLANTYYRKGNYVDCLDTLEEAVSYRDAVIRHRPGYQLVLYCYLSLMEVLAHEKRIKRLKEVSVAAHSEMERLANFHLPINNPKRAKLYRDRFNETYERVKSLLDE